MSITLTPRTQSVTLYQGDDLARIAEYDAEIERLEADKTPRLLHEPDLLAEKKAERDAFVNDAKQRAVVVELRHVGRKKWRELVDAHPPREGNENDAAVGVNEFELMEALVPASIHKPEFDSDRDRDDFLDSLSDAQFELLYMTAFMLNRTVAAAPKAFGPSAPSLSGSAT